MNFPRIGRSGSHSFHSRRGLKYKTAYVPPDSEGGTELSFARELPLTREAIPENRLVKLLRFELEALEELPPEQREV